MSWAGVDPHGSRVVLAHGGGGQLTENLLREVVMPRLANPLLDPLDDSALLPTDGPVAFTTDSYVVQPLEFPGGDIGRLAVCGTVNDLAVCGAHPRWLSLGLILEEGLELDVLGRILDSVAATAREADVHVVTGDTKVVARGQADGLYINTAGVGTLRPGVDLRADRCRPGDAILINGPIADHGMAVMLQREGGSQIVSDLASDVAPLGDLVAQLLDAVPDTRFLRDATRGGLAGVVADLASASGWRVSLDQEAIPVRPSTQYAADMLGFDVLTVANEGKVLAVVAAEDERGALEVMRSHAYGREAAVIGHIGEQRDALCELHTYVGGRRVVQKPYGEDLPRIC